MTDMLDKPVRCAACRLAASCPALPPLIVSRPWGAKGFVFLLHRRVAERMPGWPGRWRRLSRDYECLPDVSAAMVTLAMIRLLTRRVMQPNRKRLAAA